MRLRKSWDDANEQLLRVGNEGHEILQRLEDDYSQQLYRGAVTEDIAVEYVQAVCSHFLERAQEALRGIFPTEHEGHVLLRVARNCPTDTGSVFGRFAAELDRFEQVINGLHLLRKGAQREHGGAPHVSVTINAHSINDAQIGDGNVLLKARR